MSKITDDIIKQIQDEINRRGGNVGSLEELNKIAAEINDRYNLTAHPDFELLVKQFDTSSPPKFPRDWEQRRNQYGSGLVIIRSDQCPYITKSVKEITETAEKRCGITPNVVELKNYKDAQSAPSAFAVFEIIYDGKLVADHPISNTRFMNIMNKEVERHVA